MRDVIVEICCGSYYDCMQADMAGCDRIELNSALFLGGLTPTTATLSLVKEKVKAPVIGMVRPRGGGFCYQAEEFEVMLLECRSLLAAGADGIAFGILTEERKVDEKRCRQIIEIIKNKGQEVVFHRAFDCLDNPFAGMETLISLGVDRVLTSGLQKQAWDGRDMLKQLQQAYGGQIEILAGSGINSDNALALMAATGINQLHSSCKSWKQDRTTIAAGPVSYSFAEGSLADCYDVVSGDLAAALVRKVKG